MQNVYSAEKAPAAHGLPPSWQRVGQTALLLNNVVCPTEFIYICFLLCKGQGQRAAAVSAPFDKVHFAKRFR